jgi:hypothetical protein
MALFFSSSLAMDEFVIDRVVTVIGYSSIQFRSGSLSPTALTTRLGSFSMAVFLLGSAP